MMTWWRALQARRMERKLWQRFQSFRAKKPSWCGADEAEAFEHFKKLERLGPTKVRDLIARGVFD